LSIGKSEITPFKQKDLQLLLSNQICKAYGVYRKYHKEKWYTENDTFFIDCTAGNMEPAEPTSPQIILDSVLYYNKLPSRTYLIEKHEETWKTLKVNYKKTYKKRIESSKNSRVILRKSNLQKVLSRFSKNKNRFGLIYIDTNGGVLEDYMALFHFLDNNPRIDVILNVNTSILKRTRAQGTSGMKKYNDFYFSSILEKINKKYVWVRDNSNLRKNKHEFIMVFGTNMPNYNMEIIPHFIPVNSPQGSQIVYKYNHTKKEKENLHYEN